MTLTAGAWQLWHAIGRELAAVDGLIVMTGGRQARTDGTLLPTGDRALTEGMRERLTGARIDLDSRIETYLTESSLHAPSHFKLGRVRVQYLRSLAARRLAMVR